jgi:hypothetical protein
LAQEQGVAVEEVAEMPVAQVLNLTISSDDDSERSELEAVDLDQFEYLFTDQLDASWSEDENEEQKKPKPFDFRPISDSFPNMASVAEISLALVELQRKFKISGAAMDRFAQLLQVATGDNTRAPAFSQAKAMQEEGDVDFRTVDCCVNDDCVFDNAPKHCDPNRTRQFKYKDKCPVCNEPRYVLVGPDRGKPRKQMIVFPLADTVKMLFAQPDFATKLNGRFGQEHPLVLDGDFAMEVFVFVL